MNCLIDTSVLARLANTSDALYPVARHAVAELSAHGLMCRLTSQVLIEFRAVATRPKGSNGLGFSVAVAEQKESIYENAFPLLEDQPDIFPTWKTLVRTLGVIGKQVHDARLVAVCQVHSVTNLLTFNIGHFTRLATFVPGLIVVDPATV